MPRKPSANTEKTYVFFSPKALEDLRRIAEEKGTSISGLVRMIVLEYLSNKK